MKILHLTDIHFRKTYPSHLDHYKQFLPLMNSPRTFLEQVSKLIEDEKIDLIINSGDLTDDGDLDDYKELKRLFEEYFSGISQVISMGNHDNHLLFYDAFNLKKHRNNTPFFNQVYDAHNYRIVIFDNTYQGSANGFFVTEQLQWLEKTLAASKDKNVILVMHHHILDIKDQVPPVNHNQEFERIIHDSSVIFVLCGHTHHAYQGEYLNRPFSVGPSLSFRGVLERPTNSLRIEEHPGFQIIELHAQTIQIRPIFLYPTPILLGTILL